MRIIKEAEERRNEILDAAEKLFSFKGYDKTTVIDILEEVGIAKGTFYYHFKSKEDVMDAIIARIIEHDVQTAKRISLDPELTPVQKICRILTAQQPKSGDSKEKMIEQLHCPNNAEMHQKSIVQSILALSPILAEVVRQGIGENLFETGYPQETIEILIASGQIQYDPAVFQWTPEEQEKKIKAFISSAEILLGAEKGSFECMDDILTGNAAQKEK